MPCNLLKCQCGPKTIPQRYICVGICFVAVSLLFAMRVSLNLLINEMIPATEAKEKSSEYCEDRSNSSSANKTSKGKKMEKQDWSESEQSFVRASFYIGYVPAHFPVGAFADMFGGKLVLLICIISSSVFTLILPLLMHFSGHWALVGGSRILVGIGQSMMYPAVCSMTQHWIPPAERGTLGSLTFTGSHIGTLVGNVVSALLADSFGWPVPFYVWGAAGLAWSVVVFIFVHTYPGDHPYITDEEKDLLSEHIKPKEKLKVPWCPIIKDKAIWAMICGEFAHTFIFFTFNTDLPKYLSQVLRFNIRDNGLLNSLPSLGMWISSIISGKITDWMIKTKGVKVIHVRRWTTFFGNVVPGVFCVLAGYMGCNVYLSVTCLIMSLTTKGPVYSGHKVNYLEITKNFSGVAMAFINGLGCISGIAQPYIVGIVCANQKLTEWQLFFWISLSMAAIPTITYMILTTDQRSKWDYGPGETPPE